MAGRRWRKLAQIVRPETILGWHRKLIARKFGGTKQRSSVGRKPTEQEIEKRVLQFARENRSWGCRRIVGAIGNLGHEISHQTVANILKPHDLAPAPTRGKGTSWKEFIRSPLDTMAAVDFFTAEIWTAGGLTTYYVLVCLKTATREISLAGITLAPTDEGMKPTARNLTAAGDGFLIGCRYLLHDRDRKFSAGFCEILRSAGIQPLAWPPRSPHLHAHWERWNRSVKEECLAKLILYGEPALRHALTHYVQPYHEERNHQGKDNVILWPAAADRIGSAAGKIPTRERRGGLLKFSHRAAA